MVKNKSIIFTGLIKRQPDCGISMKNFYFVNKLQEYYDIVYIVGLTKTGKGKSHYPFDVIKVLFLALVHPKAKIVVSANTGVANFLIKAIVLIGMAKRCYYWVPGGVFHILVKERYPKTAFMKINRLFVQSQTMVEELKKMGFTNATYVPNSKRIFYITKFKRDDYGFIRFVFISRIHPQKGCGMIVDCAKRLNQIGYENKFVVDFYGSISPEYEEEFLNSCKKLANINYKGYLDMTTKVGYDLLSLYDIMLFPTYWWGEGFPGVIIDAYICGIPVIASDWNYNKEFIDSTTGILIHAQNEDELFREMKNTLDGKYNLFAMSRNCMTKARLYDINYVLSKSNLMKFELL